MSTKFNWYELLKISKIPENQLLLLYALYVKKHKLMARSLQSLQTKLFINYIPVDLFTRKFLLKTENGIFSNYECFDPQNYINNISFIHSKVDPIVKLEYVYILSQRHLNCQDNFIPDYYIEPKYHTNLFVYKRNGKIYFPQEKPDGTRLDKPKKTTSTRKWS